MFTGLAYPLLVAEPTIVVVKHFDNETTQEGYNGFDLECRFQAINRSDALYDVDWIIDGVVVNTKALPNVIESSNVTVTLPGSELLANASNVEKVRFSFNIIIGIMS